jgi:Flp pilus assembly protein TadB
MGTTSTIAMALTAANKVFSNLSKLASTSNDLQANRVTSSNTKSTDTDDAVKQALAEAEKKRQEQEQEQQQQTKIVVISCLLVVLVVVVIVVMKRKKK